MFAFTVGPITFIPSGSSTKEYTVVDAETDSVATISVDLALKIYLDLSF